MTWGGVTLKECDLVTGLYAQLQDTKNLETILHDKIVENANYFLGKEVGIPAYRADLWIEKRTCEKSTSIAIEVKIRDWQGGLYQAWRYNRFADISYLAIHKAFAQKIDIQEFKDANVGLIILDDLSFEVRYRPRKNITKDPVRKASVTSRIDQLLNAGENFQPVF